MKFISNLKNYRLKKKLSQAELAEKVGVRRETISLLEKAKYNPSLKLAMSIASVLCVTVEELFTFKF